METSCLPVEGAQIYLETKHKRSGWFDLILHVDLDDQVEKIVAKWNIKLTWRNNSGGQETFEFPNTPCNITKSKVIGRVMHDFSI